AIVKLLTAVNDVIDELTALIHLHREYTKMRAFILVVIDGATKGFMHSLHLRFNDLRKTENDWAREALIGTLSHDFGQTDAQVLLAGGVAHHIAVIVDTEKSGAPVVNSEKLPCFLNLSNVHRPLH